MFKLREVCLGKHLLPDEHKQASLQDLIRLVEEFGGLGLGGAEDRYQPHRTLWGGPLMLLLVLCLG